MTVLNPTSISEAFEKTAEYIESWGGDYCWFRGVNDNTLKLNPGAYWRVNYEEYEPILTFAQEGVAFTSIPEIFSWDTYHLAQHHGIPTRLLDWSESFSAALFFALDKWDGKATPCIWICKPEVLNRHFLGWSGVVAPENGGKLKNWLPNVIAEPKAVIETDKDNFIYDNEWPLAIYPKKGNRRIAAQQGTFTVHGRNKKPLDELFVERGGDRKNAFAQVNLNFGSKDKALEHLKLLGVRRSAIYPDIDNLVMQLKEHYNWR